MIQEDLLVRVVDKINKLNIPYMITGGIAVIFFGKPRLTHDFDYLKEWAKKLRVVMLLDALLKKKLRG